VECGEPVMIKVSVNTPGARFDHEYYLPVARVAQ
jgi:hypothetical protein